jgi:peroxiredoxin
MEYQTFDGKMTPILAAQTASQGGPVLLNLWASWCQPCLAELKEFSKHDLKLRGSGLQLLALSVDQLDTGRASMDNRSLERVLKQLGYIHAAGNATKGLIEELQAISDQIVELSGPLPVPTSILIDARGHLAAIYLGTLSVQQLLEDVRLLKQPVESRFPHALPFTGRWSLPPDRLSPFPVATRLALRGDLEGAQRFVSENRQRLVGNPQYLPLLIRLGDRWLAQGDWRMAQDQYAQVLDSNP